MTENIFGGIFEQQKLIRGFFHLELYHFAGKNLTLLVDRHMQLLVKFFKLIWKPSKNLVWALIVAFMLGIHNFYMGETKSKDDIIFKIEQVIVKEEAEPKD